MEVDEPSPSSRETKRTRLALEPPPPAVDPTTGRPQILNDYGPDGTPIWVVEESSEERLGKLLKRVYDEKGGIGAFTEEALERSAAAEEESEGDEDAEDEQKDEQAPVEVESEFKDGITGEQMKQLKQDVSMHLQQAYHSLSQTHHTLALLHPASHPVASDIPPFLPLPKAAFTTTRIPVPPRPPVGPTLLAEVQDSVRNTARTFERGAEELGSVVARAGAEWSVALDVKEGGWGVGLRPRPFGTRSGVPGDKKTTRDWGVWYGLDRAPRDVRARHVAHLPAPSLSPASEGGSSSEGTNAIGSASPPNLVIPNRSHRRLQVTLRSRDPLTGKVVSATSSPMALSHSPRSKVDGELEEARWESIDEEIFSKAIFEARQAPQVFQADVSVNLVTLFVSPTQTLFLSLVPSSSSLDAPPPPIDAHSAPPTLLLTFLMSSLLAIHAHQTALLSLALQPVKDPRKAVRRSPAPTLLRGVVELVQFWGFSGVVRGLLNALRQSLETGWGGKMEVDWGSIGDVRRAVADPSAVPGLGVDKETGAWKIDERGQKIVVRFEDGEPIVVHLLPPARAIYISASPTSTTVSVTDTPHLTMLLGLSLKTAILGRLASLATSLNTDSSSSQPQSTSKGFVDHLRGLAILQYMPPTGGSTREVRFEPVMHVDAAGRATLRVGATIRGTEEHRVFEGREGSEGLWKWAASFCKDAWDGRS